jgi:four helix bundle protein
MASRSQIKIRSYRDLKVWQLGMDLVVAAYGCAKQLPKFEEYGLAAQIRRAAVSVPSNIAEGHGRRRSGYLYFLSVAASSIRELETQLLLCVRLGYLGEEEADGILTMCASVGRMLAVLARKLKTTP